MTEYIQQTNDELVERLYCEGDQLSREVVDEMIRRGEGIVPLLSEIVSNQFCWTREMPDWWAVVHATNILGAIATESTVIPLLRALRWADAYNCDWLTETLPSMFGRIGLVAIEPLKAIAADITNGCFCRNLAMDGLGLIAWHYPERQKEISSFIHAIFMDNKNDLGTRQFAGDALLDLQCIEYEDDLLAFAKQEEERSRQDFFASSHFNVADVHRQFGALGVGMEERVQDWLSFYDADKIAERQRRWAKEEAESSGHESVRLSSAKVGRNEPCPCGSGKKHKKCCLGKLPE